MAYGAAADEENLLAYGGASKPVAPAPSSAQGTVAPSISQLPNPLQGAATPFSAERADLLGNFFRATWEGCQPWTEFYSTRAFSKPSFHELSDRVRSNILTFRNNYIIVASFWLGVSVIFSIPTFLVAGLGFYGVEKWATRRANKNQGALSHNDRILIVVSALFIIWITGIYGYLTMSLFFTGVTIAAHSAFHAESEPAVISAV